MPAPTPPTTAGRRAVTPTALRWICAATLVMLVVVTVAGAVVRLSGSGLGCETWPACESDSFTPRTESGMHAVIEFVNRLVSGLVGVVALAAVVGAHRRTPRRRDLVTWSWLVLALVVVNALVGAVVVETELLPATVIVHFLLAVTAVGAAVMLHHRAGLPDAAPSGDGVTAPTGALAGLRLPAHVLAGTAVVTVVLGTLVTGAGPHAGDEATDRLDLDIGSVARLHGVAAVALLLVTIWFAARARQHRAPRPVTDRVRWLTFALLTQGAIGYTQYFTGVPPLLVGAHVVGSALVWVAALLVWLSVLRAAPPPSGEGLAMAGSGGRRRPAGGLDATVETDAHT